MVYEGCACKIFDTSTRQNLIAGHRYCHALYNRMKRNPHGKYKYTLEEVREEHSCLVKCLKKNGYEHNTPLE